MIVSGISGKLLKLSAPQPSSYKIGDLTVLPRWECGGYEVGKAPRAVGSTQGSLTNGSSCQADFCLYKPKSMLMVKSCKEIFSQIINLWLSPEVVDKVYLCTISDYSRAGKSRVPVTFIWERSSSHWTRLLSVALLFLMWPLSLQSKSIEPNTPWGKGWKWVWRRSLKIKFKKETLNSHFRQWRACRI